MQNSKKLMDVLGWGVILWMFGFVLAFALFVYVPVALIGYYVLPVLIPLTSIVAYVRLKGATESLSFYLLVGISWAAIAVVLDYILLVRAFNAQNYYDADVVTYYVLTFLIPPPVGFKFRKAGEQTQTRLST